MPEPIDLSFFLTDRRRRARTTYSLPPNLITHLEFKIFPILIDHTADRCKYRPTVLTEPGGNRIKKTVKQILRVFLSTRLLICQLKKKGKRTSSLILSLRVNGSHGVYELIAARPVHLPVPLHSKHRKPGPPLPFSSRDTDPSLSSGRWEPRPSRHGQHELVHRVTRIGAWRGHGRRRSRGATGARRTSSSPSRATATQRVRAGGTSWSPSAWKTVAGPDRRCGRSTLARRC